MSKEQDQDDKFVSADVLQDTPQPDQDNNVNTQLNASQEEKTEPLVEKPEAPPKKEDNFGLGVYFFISSAMMDNFNKACVKIMYDRYPDMSVSVLISLRAVTAFILYALYLNRNLFKVMLSPTRQQIPALAFRVVQGCTSLLIQMLALKYFNLMLYALIMNLEPLISVILGMTFLKESLAWREALVLAVSFTAVVLVIAGSNPDLAIENAEDQNAVVKKEWWMWVILFLNPLIKSASSIAMRSVKKLHVSVVSCWLNISQVALYVPATYILGYNLSVVTEFNWLDWIVVLCVGGLTVFVQTFTMLALKHCQVAKLQPYAFVGPVQQYFTDIILFHIKYTAVQISGIALLCFSYFCRIIYQCFKSYNQK